MRLNDLLQGIADLRLMQGQSEREVAALVIDSRAARPNALFAALPGSKADGRTFIADALARGASALLVPEGSAIQGVAPGIAVIEAKDPRAALAKVAARFHVRQPEMIAAVTGTGGKTSTVAFLRQLWSLEGRQAASLGTLGVISPVFNDPGSLTTPDSIQLHEILAKLANGGVTHLAMEASSHGLDQRRLDGVAIGAAAFTNLSHDHLDYHPDMESYLQAKLRLFAELLPEGGTAVINADAPEAERIVAIAKSRHHRIVRVGTQPGGQGGDVQLLARRPSADGQVLELAAFGQKLSVAFPVAGLFQAANLVTALGLAIGSGSSPQMMLGLVSRLTGVPGRIERVTRTPNGASVYVDYAHKPGALESVLMTLRPHTNGRLIVVFGCGGDRDRAKRKVMGEIATRLADKVIVTDDNPRSEDPATIRAEILSAAPAALEIGDRAEAIRAAMRELKAGDLLVIAGKGHETYQIVGDKTLPFDDAEVARRVAQEMSEQVA